MQYLLQRPYSHKGSSHDFDLQSFNLRISNPRTSSKLRPVFKRSIWKMRPAPGKSDVGSRIRILLVARKPARRVSPSVRGWWNAVGNLIEFLLAQKGLQRPVAGLNLQYVCENQRGKVSSSSRLQAVPAQQSSANLWYYY